MNQGVVEPSLAFLIERSADLKRDLVDFACSSRLERSLAAAMLEAGVEGEVEEADAIGIIDRFTGTRGCGCSAVRLRISSGPGMASDTSGNGRRGPNWRASTAS